MAEPFESLDYLYIPAPEFDAAVRFYTVTIGGELRWRIHDGGVRVAAVRLARDGPPVVWPRHLEPRPTLLIYRVRSLDAVRRRLTDDGWSDVDPPFEIPQ